MTVEMRWRMAIPDDPNPILLGSDDGGRLVVLRYREFGNPNGARHLMPQWSDWIDVPLEE